MAKRNYPGKLEQALVKLSPEERENWKAFAVRGRVLTELQAWWLERGIHLSCDSIATWRDRNLKLGERAEIIAQTLSKSRGISPIGAIEHAIVLSATVANSIEQHLKETDGEYSKTDLQILLNSAKELRSAGFQLGDSQFRVDRVENILAGAYELASRVTRAAQGDSRAEFVETILKIGLSQLEDELQAGRVLNNSGD